MSKLHCHCGHIILDQEDNLPFKANIIPDESFYEFADKIEDIIDKLIDATKRGTRIEWIKENFHSSYPESLSDAQMIYDIITLNLFNFRKEIFQCEVCGRILIENSVNQFDSFIPEKKEWNLVLKKKR